LRASHILNFNVVTRNRIVTLRLYFPHVRNKWRIGSSLRFIAKPSITAHGLKLQNFCYAKLDERLFAGKLYRTKIEVLSQKVAIAPNHMQFTVTNRRTQWAVGWFSTYSCT